MGMRNDGGAQNVDNLTVIIDYNKWQATDHLLKIMSTRRQKWALWLEY